MDLVHTLRPTRRGAADPTCRFSANAVARATRTPEGPATVRLTLVGDAIRVEGWGPGATWALDRAERLLGLDASTRAGAAVDDFATDHPLIARLAARLPGLRLARTDAVFEALAPAICEQKVTGFEARRSWRQIVTRWGEPAPGPGGLWLPPTPAALAGAAYHELHPLGLERKRADTLRRAASTAGRLEALVDGPTEALAIRLSSITGVGPWTTAEVTRVAGGDPDAVSVGDYHLPTLVTWALAGERPGTDRRMLELLEPFAGARAYVVRLLEIAGPRPPRLGPRLAPRDFRAQ